jgi:hypothetical protein
MSFFDTCPGSKRIKEPFPETIKCQCGKEIEIWSDETEATCHYCDKKINRGISGSCLDWCSVAKECVGEEKYNRYKKQKGG